MSITVIKEKEINKINEMLNNNHDVIKEAYELLTGEELSEDITTIEVYNIEKVVTNDVITYFLGISFDTNSRGINITNATIDYNINAKNIKLNTNYMAFMDIEEYEAE